METYASEFEFDFGDEELRGRVILVAGGSGGLGSATVALLAREGCRVVVGYRSNEERAQRLRRAMKELYDSEIRLVGGDISDSAVRSEYLKAAADEGPLYGLVTLTGNPARVPLETADDDALLESMRENYTGPLLLARDAAETMKIAKTGGAIVFVSSMQAVIPFPNSFAYAAPKVALTHAARIMAKQWKGPEGPRVNVVAPGVNRAGMALASISSGKYDPFVENGTIPRFGRAEDVGRAVRLLVQPDNYITGQVIVVDGGFTLRA